MSVYTELLRDNIGSIKADEARQYLLTEGYMTDGRLLPGFVKVSGLEQLQLKPIAWGKDYPAITSCIQLMTPKGMRGLRVHSIMHPYIYWHLVATITESPNTWNSLVSILSAPSKVEVYSLPTFNREVRVLGEDTKNPWKRMTEIELPEDALNYTCLASLDIQNFYGSVYTHSISWAFHGQHIAKRNRRDYSLLGNKLDKLFQNAHDGQTNGIPLGNSVSDLVAEVILKKVDISLSQKLKDLDMRAYRYRDDYRFLCKTEAAATKVLNELTIILQNEFNLSVNDLKTRVESDTIINSLKPWHHALIQSPLLSAAGRSVPGRIEGKWLNDLLLASHQHQTIHGASFGKSFLINLLRNILDDKIAIDDPKEYLGPIITVLVKLTTANHELTPFAFAIIQKLLNSTTSARRVNTLKSIIGSYDEPSSLHEIWLYRLALGVDTESANLIRSSSLSLLMRMLSNTETHDYLFFDTEKSLAPEDQIELTKFKLICIDDENTPPDNTIFEELGDLMDFSWYE